MDLAFSWNWGRISDPPRADDLEEVPSLAKGLIGPFPPKWQKWTDEPNEEILGLEGRIGLI